jgi:hypothetical protein
VYQCIKGVPFMPIEHIAQISPPKFIFDFLVILDKEKFYNG